MNKQEKEEYRMYVENLYDTMMNIKEERGISYGELYHIQNLKLKELKELEEELNEEMQRIIDIVKDYM